MSDAEIILYGKMKVTPEMVGKVITGREVEAGTEAQQLARGILRLVHEIERRDQGSGPGGMRESLPLWVLDLARAAHKALGEESLAEIMARWDQESKDEAPF